MSTDKNPIVLFQLKRFLEKLKQMESLSPSGRTVPTITEFAGILGIYQTHFSTIINNRQDYLSRSQIALIIRELRRRGFDVTFNDLFEYIEIPAQDQGD